ncbi:tyrosine-type recombinase/integrase [Leisingera caerulea]|uniref:Tyrosine-type recombinase/integrase n=1 Tax=Leisingera caerulea TaxID=506591 RepID=A0ABY5WT53_LEICA|nr:tyrosine-type recombinase/integrase [Leisingera caerulea]UWQ57280.1 tyrosine-type recombinase/integrase [Leisingera caerulea]
MAEDRVKLNETMVRNMTREDWGREYVADSAQVGLFLRVRESGHKTYVVRKRVPGSKRRISEKIGSPMEGMTLVQARKRAAEVLYGGAERVREQSLDDMYEVWKVDTNLPKDRADWTQYQKDCVRYFEKSIRPYFKLKPVTDIDQYDAQAFYNKLDHSKVHTANRTKAMLSKLLTIAVTKGLISVNPCSAVKTLPEEERTRVYHDAEQFSIWDAIDAVEGKSPISAVNALRCVMLMPMRDGEILKMRWDQFDFEQGFWYLPKSMRKGNIGQTAPLTGAFNEFMRSLPRLSDEWVFPAPKDNTKPLEYSVLRRVWLKVRPDKNSKMHDFRRTIATDSVRYLRGDLMAASQMLGHKDFRTTQKSYVHLTQERPVSALEEHQRRFLKGKDEAKPRQPLSEEEFAKLLRNRDK